MMDDRQRFLFFRCCVHSSSRFNDWALTKACVRVVTIELAVQSG